MKYTYIIDNDQSYSAHALYFVYTSLPPHEMEALLPLIWDGRGFDRPFVAAIIPGEIEWRKGRSLTLKQFQEVTQHAPRFTRDALKDRFAAISPEHFE